MLKFFFHRKSPMVAIMRFLAFSEVAYLIYGAFTSNAKIGFNTLFLIISWVVLNLLDWIPWYPFPKEKLGIRVHFEKNLVPMSYLLVFAFALKLAGVSEWILSIFSLLLLPVFYVSGMLLYFHFRDPSQKIPGYFSHNFYLQEKESSCTR